MLRNSLTILLAERVTTPKASALDATTDMFDLEQKLAGASVTVVVGKLSIGLLRAIAQCLAAADL